MTDDADDSLRRRAWEGVADAIRHGGYRPGERLPPERELAVRLDVSRSTLRLALHDLERAGVVVRRPGRGGGTFVTAPRAERGLAGLREYVRRPGLVAGVRVIAVLVAPAGRTAAEALRLSPDEPVVLVTRVRIEDGEPVALERSGFPAGRFPGLAEQPLGGSLHGLLRARYGEAPDRAVERITPVAADEEHAALLDVPPGTPLLAVERVAYNAAGEPIEHATDLVRGDHTRVVVCGPGGPAGGHWAGPPAAAPPSDATGVSAGRTPE